MAEYLSFSDTGYFSKTATDYINGQPSLRPFYSRDPSWAGAREAIKARRLFPQQRDLLADCLLEQYQGLPLTEKLKTNIDNLRLDNTFTVTTAHQPNIFTGPLYLMYKILHVVKLAQELKKQIPENNYVPVYYMGSEDADLDELGQFTVHGKKYVWETGQTGAVGRMVVDEALLKLLKELKGQIDVEPYGKMLTGLFQRCYTPGTTIQQATLEIIHSLFGKYGLVVLIPDNGKLKKIFEPVIIKELKEEFSHKIVEATAAGLEAAGYPQQATGRALNLFYLIKDKRERIEKKETTYRVPSLQLQWTEAEILEELRQYPERFSGNVLLRGAFQETILPNIIFVGGGGELAYWLELKEMFGVIHVPYPMLLLRNSFMLLNSLQEKRFRSLHIDLPRLFKDDTDILNYLSERHNGKKTSLDAEKIQLLELYRQMGEHASRSAFSLKQHTHSLYLQSLHRVEALEKKMQKAERKKLSVEEYRLSVLKEDLFPGGSLQERVENMATYFPTFGPGLLDTVLAASPALPSSFVCCFLSEK